MQGTQRRRGAEESAFSVLASSRLCILGVVAAAATGLATGCATQTPRGSASPWYPPPLGTRVVLPEAITIPARSARVYFQDGRITGRGVNHFAPHCQLEVNRVSAAPQTVPTGVFTVTDVHRRTSEVVDSRAVQVAGRIGIGIGIGLFGSDVGDIMQAWHMRLHADDRADVRALICGGAFDHPSQAQTPSIDQMRRALGEHVRLELPEEKAP